MKFMKDNKIKILICAIFIVGFLVRILGIQENPNGLNTDEASIGYEAYSVLNYGIDRNGNSWPVFLEAWGSGQNALYMYIIMPFVKILGLSVLSVRLPMAIMGCVSLVVMYKLLLKTGNKKLAIIGLAFFAITPWHIMKSRFGLESNIFPDLMLYAVYFIMSYLEEKKSSKMYIASVFMGLCGYAYGTAYYFLPIFVLALLITLYIKKEINIKTALISFAIIFAISIPIMLMVIINTFNLEQLQIGSITIPRLEENRYEKLTLLSSENIIETLWKNFSEAMKILYQQKDDLNINTLDFFGIIYVFSVPFTIIGIISSFRKKDEDEKYKKIKLIFNIWFIVAFLLTFICEPNINRMNILYIPLIYYTIIGIYKIVNYLKWTGPIILIIYVASFVCFEKTYFNTDFTETFTVVSGVENVIKYTQNIDAETIYFENAFKEPYIYVCFINQENTKEFVSTVAYRNNRKDFNSVMKFGKYKFYLPKELKTEGNKSYVMKKETASNYEIDENVWNIKYIDDFCILEKTKRE